MANEQDAAATNNAEQAPQTYTWSAVTDPAECVPFSVSVIQNTLEIDLNEDNPKDLLTAGIADGFIGKEALTDSARS